MACDPSNEIERSPDQVIRIPLPQDSGVSCVQVQPGDTVILPFDVSTADISNEMTIRARQLDGALVIEQDEGVTILLEGFVQTVEKEGQELTVSGVDGTRIDIALWLAVTDPNLLISH